MRHRPLPRLRNATRSQHYETHASHPHWPCPFKVERLQGRDALEGGEPSLSPDGLPDAKCQPQWHLYPTVTARQPPWQPPPTAHQTASGAASEVPPLLMHPCSRGGHDARICNDQHDPDLVPDSLSSTLCSVTQSQCPLPSSGEGAGAPAGTHPRIRAQARHAQTQTPLRTPPARPPPPAGGTNGPPRGTPGSTCA